MRGVDRFRKNRGSRDNCPRVRGFTYGMAARRSRVLRRREF